MNAPWDPKTMNYTLQSHALRRERRHQHLLIGDEEGHTCNRKGCKGIMEYQHQGNCSCHISPPCHYCVEQPLICNECGEEADIPKQEWTGFSGGDGISVLFKRRDLDPTKIDWHDKPHSGCSMIKEGIYPPGTEREGVRKLVNGTFGGHFEHFGNGRFKFIAYTD